MSQDSGEVSWQTLRRIVQRWSGDEAELAAVSSLDGGSISTALMIETETEAHQLRYLKTLGLPAPAVLDCHIGTLDSPDSYILLERMPGVSLAEARKKCSEECFDRLQEQLAEIVITLHRCTGQHYCKVEPRLPKAAERIEAVSWPAFYRSLYDEIWRECEKHAAIPTKARKLVGRIHEKLERLLDHSDQPRLTHGDLWASNVLAREGEAGKWNVSAVIDPNCRFAHAECELAYLDLFHTSTPAFNKVYNHTFRIDDGYYAYRKHVYQLYELVNHVNLFGDRYVKPMLAALEKVAAFV